MDKEQIKKEKKSKIIDKKVYILLVLIALLSISYMPHIVSKTIQDDIIEVCKSNTGTGSYSALRDSIECRGFDGDYKPYEAENGAVAYIYYLSKVFDVYS